MNESILYAGSGLFAKTVLYPIDNMTVFQQVRGTTMRQTLSHFKRGGFSTCFAGYSWYSSRIFLHQIMKWEIFSKLNTDNNTVLPAIIAATCSTIAIQPIEYMRQRKIFKLNSLKFSNGLGYALLYSNAYNVTELSVYSLLKRNDVSSFFMGPIIFFCVRLTSHPIETMMRIKMTQNSTDLTFKRLYNGFCVSVIKSSTYGFIHYLIFESIKC